MQPTHRGTAISRSVRAKPAHGNVRSHGINGASTSSRACDACHWGVFCQTVTDTQDGYPRQLNSILGSLTLTSTQAEQLGVSAYSRLSPHLELCCLRQSAILSYQKAEAEVELQTGRRVSAKTQER